MTVRKWCLVHLLGVDDLKASVKAVDLFRCHLLLNMTDDVVHIGSADIVVIHIALRHLQPVFPLVIRTLNLLQVSFLTRFAIL